MGHRRPGELAAHRASFVKMYNSHSIFAVSSLDLTQPFKGVGTGTFIMSMLQMKKLRLRELVIAQSEKAGELG